MFCHKFEMTKLGSPEKISDKKPIVLFYNKFKNSVLNLLNPKTCVQTNLLIMNNQQNVGQQNINPQLMNQQFNQKLINPQIMNNQNNIINFDNNQGFMNQQNCFQNNFKNNINNNNIFGNNMNQFNNMNNNNNMQMNNMNMNNVNNINNTNNGFMMNNNDGNMNMQFQNNMMMNNNMMNNMNNMNMMNNNKINMQNNFQNNNPNLVSFDEIIVIQFISGDSTVNKGIKCLPTQKFYEVEEKLYNFYPEHRKNNNNFITNGRPVIRFYTIAENNIKDGQVVQIIPVD